MATPYYPIQFRKIFKKIFRRDNTLMIPISKKLEELCKLHNVKNYWLRPNPIDEKRFFFVDKEKKYKLRNTLTNFSDKDIVLTHIASYMKQKNHIFILEILKRLPDNYKAYLGGPVANIEQEENFKLVEDKIKEHSLNKRVFLKKGFIENIDEYIKLSDVFLFPTWNEALGTPILEAQACGVPVVANLMLGSSDNWIKDGVSGYLVEKFDAEIWAEKIKMSLNLTDEILLENSLNILQEASTKKIDEEYFKKLKLFV